LIDMARRYSGAYGLGANHASIDGKGRAHGGASAAGPNPSDTTRDPDRLAAWSDFHREAESLPLEEREAFDLLFYQGLSQAEAAAVLDVSERTIKRRWQSARLRLVQKLGGRMPGL
jgi:RNA polymerase sigma-70 factor (ECF subfamily)